ncbi:hypothetical protein J7I93_20900 [Bacillus sp. ISL-47]|uniref:S-Ena type endospore appendage n=1 Tax=Bacillus sp. ISL-47 TaxID=2819130 RepID=UPI001BE6BB39|nr:S-Ena type endospore appendage [Bacillus sp. ISL-47]MBT2690618.1 hypothetical protein [Bacillus sp. ISL-47]MBT2711186.1 hypothetical protein [Pseudomonas sp. ISL-84]
MCNSNEFNCGCCPPAQVFQEKICGNYSGGSVNNPIWSAPAGTYLAGVFQVFNSANSTATPGVRINGQDRIPPLPGQTMSYTVDNPTSLEILGAEGASGTYCIILYRRVLT